MRRFIDLTHPLEQGQPSFPGDAEMTIAPFATIASHRCNTTRFTMGSHQGTHLDAPFHFFEDGATVDQIDLERLCGPARLLDLAPGGALEPGARLTPESFEQHAELFQPGARVLYRTGWDQRFGGAEFFEGYPALTPEAARWIASRGIALLGMDTPSPSDDWLPVHQALLGPGAGIVIVESLANLHRLPAQFTFIGFPLKLKGRDGSPIRAVAALED